MWTVNDVLWEGLNGSLQVMSQGKTSRGFPRDFFWDIIDGPQSTYMLTDFDLKKQKLICRCRCSLRAMFIPDSRVFGLNLIFLIVKEKKI